MGGVAERVFHVEHAWPVFAEPMFAEPMFVTNACVRLPSGRLGRQDEESIGQGLVLARLGV